MSDLQGKTKTSSETEGADEEYERHFRAFQKVLAVEHEAIDARRKRLDRSVRPWPAPNPGKKGGAQRPMYIASGIALSGGGIRSAAFCLGALQCFAVNDLFDRFDYLSTVSGGGYVGASVSAAMSRPMPAGATRNFFPFSRYGRYDDEPSVGHLRDYSNYILPRGQQSLGDAIGVVLRGLATNAIIVLAFVFLLATFTVLAFPDRRSLWAGSFAPQIVLSHWPNAFLSGLFGNYPFGLTLRLAILVVLYMSVWSIWRSLRLKKGNDVRGPGIVAGRWLLLVVILCAMLDLQPLAIAALIWMHEANWSKVVEWVTAALAPFAGLVAFFSGRLSRFVRTAKHRAGTGALLGRLVSLATIWAAALVLPLLIWLFYLWICTLGMPDSGFLAPAQILRKGFTWLASHPGAVAVLYFIIGFVLLALTWSFSPNANSLHQLYRDKLSKAFLFDPDRRAVRADSEADQGDLVAADCTRLSNIAPEWGGPYHLINAAINLQGSAQANRRGRNASFFQFSAKHVGSDATGYLSTRELEDNGLDVDLGSAMAISGAALSSEMGSASIAPLAPTLALLNLRLGYWLENPNPNVKKPGLLSRAFKGYLFAEMFGRLDETAPKVYVTDGGHIENLGLYSLLRRHCSVIVVIDGEADPALTFRALSLCERYARIDLGVRLDLPWREIADVGNAATKKAEKGKPLPTAGGPHCAVGTILYPDDSKGVLLYVKASLTGDEPDYVLDYKKRYPVFPHESTGDQFFTEEQFEAYRALGFHAVDGFLAGARAFTSSADVQAAANIAGLTVPEYVISRLRN